MRELMVATTRGCQSARKPPTKGASPGKLESDPFPWELGADGKRPEKSWCHARVRVRAEAGIRTD